MGARDLIKVTIVIDSMNKNMVKTRALNNDMRDFRQLTNQIKI